MFSLKYLFGEPQYSVIYCRMKSFACSKVLVRTSVRATLYHEATELIFRHKVCTGSPLISLFISLGNFFFLLSRNINFRRMTQSVFDTQPLVQYIRLCGCNCLNVLVSFSPTANRNKIREAHRKLMILNHPDRGETTISVLMEVC